VLYLRILAALIVLAALAGAVKWSVDTIHKAGERDKFEQQLRDERAENARNITAISRDIAQGESDRVDFANRFDSIDAAVAALTGKVGDPSRFVQSRSLPNDPCPRVAIGPDFLGLYNEAADITRAPKGQTR
jgi:hypothetical protein